MTKIPFSLTRREFLRSSAILGAGLVGAQRSSHKTGIIARPLLKIDSLQQFVDPLPIPATIRPVGRHPMPGHRNELVPFYRLAMREISSKIHRDVKPTRFWGYREGSPGPSFEIRSGEGSLVEWANELPVKHFLPIDHTVHGAEAGNPQVRVVTHLHGGRVPAESDGYPEAWYAPGKSATYYYPNDQEAAHLWYHDHALGITRLNMYAGLFGSFFVRDAFEDGLNLPKGKYEIPLTIFDRSFDREGQLYYPISPDPASAWVSEVFGEVILVNGKLFPYLDVEPRKYRFRLLNAANGRFFHLALSKGEEFHQIGTDLGFLPAPVALKSLTVAPGERADLILDFSGHAGGEILLTNDDSAVLQFRVSKTGSPDTSSLPSSLRPIGRIPESAASNTRLLTLGEKDDRGGNATMLLLNNARWSDPVTEKPAINSTEIWNLLNFTDDSHPIHLHLVRFQILDRRSFEPEYYYQNGKIVYTGQPVPPSANEAGWKDTVQAHSGMITRIITRFEGYPGRYVWHCHILEHEDNEMMRPYEILGS
jgi:spore coat protein A